MSIEGLIKGARFKALDKLKRDVVGVCLDVFPWSEWPYKCDARVDGVRRMVQYRAEDFLTVEVLHE